MATTNYSNRKVDLLIFQGWAESGETLITAGFGDTGYVVTGIMKLIQQFAVRFLTGLDTAPHNTEFGTEFMTDLRAGYIRADADVLSAFSAAVANVKAQLKTIYDEREGRNETIPDDEKLDNARLVSYDISPGSLFLRVEITSQDGRSREVVLPVAIAM
tara:strand:+ start:1393 stop:1869 length:477 start_codon:yes stop_codon:yes gene_type:complete